MKSTVENRTIAMLTLFSVIIITVVLAVIWPTISYIKRIRQDTYELRAYLERKYESVANLKRSAKKIDELNDETLYFGQYLFRRGDELKLITALENLAVKNKVTQKIESSNLDKITGSRLTLTLALSGPYTQVLNYINQLEKINYFVIIEGLQLSPASTLTGPTNSVNARLNLSLYVSQ